MERMSLIVAISHLHHGAHGDTGCGAGLDGCRADARQVGAAAGRRRLPREEGAHRRRHVEGAG